MSSSSASNWPPVRSLPGEYGIYRLAPEGALPAGLAEAPMTFVSRTDEELSVVCSTATAQAAGLDACPGVEVSDDWNMLKVEGPIDFSVVGLLAAISSALAAAQISLFALSTYDTDYVMVPAAKLSDALAALSDVGFSQP